MLRWGMLNDMTSFDSHQAKGGNIPNSMLYDPLLGYNQDQKGNWQASPRLATEWDLTEKSVTFKLRKGVKFHDGSDFNAQVAKWNLDRMTTWKKSRLRENLNVVDSIDVVDDYTVRLNLKSPSAVLMLNLSDGAPERPDMLSQAAMEKLGEDGFVQHPVGSGPMQFQEAVNGDHYTLKRVEGYWMKGADDKPLPYLDGATYRLLTDDAVRLLEIRSGNIDISEEVFPKDVGAVKSNPDLDLVEMPWQVRSYLMVFNMDSGPFAKNLKLRQAVAYALDREGIAKVLGFGIGKGAKGFRQPGMLGYDASTPYYWYDPAKSKQALEESGWDKANELELMVHNRTVDQQQGQIVKEQLDKAGIPNLLAVADRTANIKKREAGLFTFLALQHNQESEPEKQFSMPFECKGAGNYSRYCNPEFDKALAAGRTTYDLAKRQEAYVNAERLMFNDVPATYLWTFPRAIAIRKSVKNYSNTMGWSGTDFRETWLDK
ncbi:MAG: ABC transporter substrate-binding protein [Actinobacteria bacterium]|nr:ABC transporter substrate-binding protein [Actinomycetota bacterium]